MDYGDGCFTIELIDEEDMGLHYWAYPAQGYGYLRFLDLGSVLIKNFNSDFGRSIFYTFNMGDVSYIQEPNLEGLIIVHPNPFNDKVYIDFVDMSGDVVISIYNLQGQTVYKKKIHQNDAVRFLLDLSSQPSGLYVVQVNQGSLSIRKKIIKR